MVTHSTIQKHSLLNPSIWIFASLLSPVANGKLSICLHYIYTIWDTISTSPNSSLLIVSGDQPTERNGVYPKNTRVSFQWLQSKETIMWNILFLLGKWKESYDISKWNTINPEAFRLRLPFERFSKTPKTQPSSQEGEMTYWEVPKGRSFDVSFAGAPMQGSKVKTLLGRIFVGWGGWAKDKQDYKTFFLAKKTSKIVLVYSFSVFVG